MGTLLKTRVKPDNDRIMSSIICINGEHSYLISLMPFFYSRPMVHMFQNLKMLGWQIEVINIESIYQI